MPAFLDSNVVLYALGADNSKRAVAERLLASAPCISAQVVNECSHVLRRKAGWSPATLAAHLPAIFALTHVHPIGIELIRDAWRIAERYGYGHYDSLIIASALAAGCDPLYSEDLQHGQHIDSRMTIANPFV
jgi:predicted nucleic acid-binding protein